MLRWQKSREVFSVPEFLALTFYNKRHPPLHKQRLCNTQRLSQSFRTEKQTGHLLQHDGRIYTGTDTQAPSPATGHCRHIPLLVHREAPAQHQEPPIVRFCMDLKGLQLQLNDSTTQWLVRRKWEWTNDWLNMSSLHDARPGRARDKVTYWIAHTKKTNQLCCLEIHSSDYKVGYGGNFPWATWIIKITPNCACFTKHWVVYRRNTAKVYQPFPSLYAHLNWKTPKGNSRNPHSRKQDMFNKEKKDVYSWYNLSKIHTPNTQQEKQKMSADNPRRTYRKQGHCQHSQPNMQTDFSIFVDTLNCYHHPQRQVKAKEMEWPCQISKWWIPESLWKYIWGGCHLLLQGEFCRF